MRSLCSSFRKARLATSVLSWRVTTHGSIWNGAARTAQTRPTSRREFYVEQTDIEQMDRQMMDDEDYGIWN